MPNSAQMDEYLDFLKAYVEGTVSQSTWQEWWVANATTIQTRMSRLCYLRLKHQPMQQARAILDEHGVSYNDGTFPMHGEWHIYEQMRNSGVSSHDVYKQGQRHGLDRFALLRMLRSVFSLGLSEAKEVMIQADGIASSLLEHEERLLPALKQALEDAEDETVS